MPIELAGSSASYHSFEIIEIDGILIERVHVSHGG